MISATSVTFTASHPYMYSPHVTYLFYDLGRPGVEGY